MRVMKFITYSMEESAAKNAAEYFGTDETNIVLTVSREPEEDSAGLALARLRELDGADTSDTPAYFDLFFEEDGVYMEVYPAAGKGAGLDRNDALEYFKLKNLKMQDTPALTALLDREEGRARIAPVQENILINEDIEITIGKNNMEATIRFLPYDRLSGGNGLDVKGVFGKLEAAGIVHGLKVTDIRAACKEKLPGEKYVIAQGSEPVNGEDGRIEFHFRFETARAPKDIGEGRVDYRDLDLFEPVQKGRKLVTKILPTAGTPGKTVKGAELPPRPGKEKQLPKGTNTYKDEEGLNMFAKVGGMVSFIGGAVMVSDTYTVPGNCDMGVGNINFNGNVDIRGGVMQNLEIRATGNITIGETVEGATLIAGGDIELKKGILGVDRGVLEAGGSVRAQFIERAKVTAGKEVVSDVIMHSDVAAEVVRTEGKRRSIMGGRITASKHLTAGYLGSVSGTATTVDVGLLPGTRDRINFLENDIMRINEELEKLGKLEQYFEKTKGTPAEEKNAEMAKSVQASMEQNRATFESHKTELVKLHKEAADAVYGKVHVTGAVYPGVNINISTAKYRVANEITFATFRLSDGEITFAACEV